MAVTCQARESGAGARGHLRARQRYSSHLLRQTNRKTRKDKTMRHQKKANPAVGILAVVVLLAGCAEVGFLGSKNQTFRTTDSMLLDTPRADILDLVADVGKSMKFDVSAIDKNTGSITLSSSAAFATTVLIGKMNNSNLKVTIQDGGKKLDIWLFIMGNFGTGGQEAAEKLVNDFKTRLRERLGMRS